MELFIILSVFLFLSLISVMVFSYKVLKSFVGNSSSIPEEEFHPITEATDDGMAEYMRNRMGDDRFTHPEPLPFVRQEGELEEEDISIA